MWSGRRCGLRYDISVKEEVARIQRRNSTKKVLMTQTTTMIQSLT